MLVLAIILALIPALIWAGFLLKNPGDYRMAFRVFLRGVLAVLLMLGIQFLGDYLQAKAIVVNSGILGLSPGFLRDWLLVLWGGVLKFYPTIFIYSFGINVWIVYLVIGFLEEFLKQILVREVDQRSLLIADISSSIRFSFLAALGFAFGENIFYFYNIYEHLGAGALFAPVVFRTTFTTAAHLTFSGLFGYYYGLGKFCVSLVQEQTSRQKSLWFSKLIAKLTGMPITQAFRELMVMKGLILAMLLHGLFNVFLFDGRIFYAISVILLGFAYLVYLLKRQSSNVVLLIDVDSRQVSSMAARDEETVIEFIGEEYNKGHFSQVVEICDRLLERDADNQVVRLFQAKALDKIKLQNYIHALVERRK